MLIDGRDIQHGRSLATRVCIVGAGAAGITIARELSRAQIETLLVESGGFELQPETQALYEGEVEGPLGQGYLTRSRLRYFGGTTNHWGGNCRPLDPIDFESRPGVRSEGWPFSRAELDPFYRRAAVVCEIDPFPDAPAEKRLADSSPFAFAAGAGIRSRAFHTSPPTRFGVRYRDELAASPHVRVVTNANVLEFVTDADGGRVARMHVRTDAHRELEIRPEVVVLATGGIENARLLLLSRATHTAGLGNRYDLVGRYFSEHGVIWNAATLIGWRSVQALRRYSFAHRRRPEGGTSDAWRIFCLDEAHLRDEALLNGYIALAEPGSVPGPEAAARSPGFELAAEVASVSGALDDPGRRPGGRIATASLVNAAFEPRPDPENRVTLDERLDWLGQPSLRLRWRPSASDLDSVRRSLELLAIALGRASLGRLRISDRLRPGLAAGASHHMGTTRMHASPRQGVVDADCRLHGVSNVFVAGSSVFPAYGYANPTLTLLALALRLADRIIAANRRPAAIVGKGAAS